MASASTDIGMRSRVRASDHWHSTGVRMQSREEEPALKQASAHYGDREEAEARVRIDPVARPANSKRHPSRKGRVRIGSGHLPYSDWKPETSP